VTEREVIYEFVQIGNSVKVTAMDPATLVEASIVGPATATEMTLKAAALRKLNYVIARKARPGGTEA
jgi:hypothetical protein